MINSLSNNSSGPTPSASAIPKYFTGSSELTGSLASVNKCASINGAVFAL